MTFDDILAQILDILKRQGRVSYSALKRRFDLDDDYLNDLKDELLFAHPVVDEDNRGLVWTGATESVKEVVAQPAQPTPPPAVQEQPSPEVPPRSTAPPDAERRQLTVMFIDIVESTSLSSQLDPEDYREVVRAYQSACTEVIQRYDGHIAQLLGDGLLVYFGYPHAHEDDPHRAVRTGLGILAAMEDLNKELKRDKGITLAVRLGIHTGLVVVGAMGGGGRQEQLALGESPNIAARIQGLAASDTIAISEATYRIVEGYFSCECLGEHTLRGVSQPLNIYRVLSESGVHSRLEVAQTRGLTPLVGRESEVTLLLERWEQVKAGQGQVVLLTGDAGIGKSRLVQMLKEHIAQEPHTRWECRSAEHYQNTALFPLTDLFQRLWQFQTADTPDEKLVKLAHALSQYRLPVEESVQLFAPLLSVPVPAQAYPALHLSPQRMRQRTLEALVALLLERAEHQPLLFILEDLHWTDPTTLEWLHLLIDQTPTASMLVLLTCRPHFQPAWHHRSYLTEMTVHRLSHAQVEQIVTGITDGKAFPAAVLQQMREKTDGVPLFVEEMTKAVLESGALKESNGQYAIVGSLASLAIPATLHDSLMARLDRLVTAKAIAQYAAVIGRQFSYALLQAVSQLDEVMLQHELSRLVEAELLYQRGLPPHATYTFKHALIQDTAYESLLRSTRQRYHRRIAEVFVERFPGMAATQPEVLAYHWTEAQRLEQAIDQWYRACQKARDQSAHREAIHHLTTGLALLARLPATPERAEQELVFQSTLGQALMITKGYADPEAERACARTRALGQQSKATPQLATILVGLRRFYVARGEYQTAYEVGAQLLALAQHQPDPAIMLMAHVAIGPPLLCLGSLNAAYTHFEQAIALYTPSQHHELVAHYGMDPGVISLMWAAVALWVLGYPAQARQRCQEALTLAQELPHPLSRVYAWAFAAVVHLLCHEWRTSLEQAEVGITPATEHGLGLWIAQAMILRGRALVALGHEEEGLASMHQGFATLRSVGGAVFLPLFLSTHAESYGVVGKTEQGLTVLGEALAVVAKNNERWYEAALHRLKGELLLQQSADNQAEAEACFHHALDIARNQQAKSLELRAAHSLAKLWQHQGKRQEARDLLAPLYHWFTEGFDTADLQDAKALLDELEGGR